MGLYLTSFQPSEAWEVPSLYVPHCSSTESSLLQKTGKRVLPWPWKGNSTSPSATKDRTGCCQWLTWLEQLLSSHTFPSPQGWNIFIWSLYRKTQPICLQGTEERGQTLQTQPSSLTRLTLKTLVRRYPKFTCVCPVRFRAVVQKCHCKSTCGCLVPFGRCLVPFGNEAFDYFPIVDKDTTQIISLHILVKKSSWL